MTWVGLGHDIWTISQETITEFFIVSQRPRPDLAHILTEAVSPRRRVRISSQPMLNQGLNTMFLPSHLSGPDIQKSYEVDNWFHYPYDNNYRYPCMLSEFPYRAIARGVER